MSGESQYPWIAGDLIIRREVLDAIYAHAAEQYPNECCGFIAGPASDPHLLDEAIFEVNEADRYHRLDPIRFPRTARTYFKIHELRAAKRFERGEASGRPIKVIYHSHCDAGPYFSAEDAATFASGGQLMWPCAFLVVSVVGGRPEEHRLWVHVPGTDSFRESPIRIA
jgi:proteasome lid subunit RPN8/RPN11